MRNIILSLISLPAYIRDDRGRRVPLLRAESLSLEWPQDEQLAARTMSMRNPIWLKIPRDRRIAGVGLIALELAIVAILSLLIFRWDSGLGAWRWPLMLAIGSFLGFVQALYFFAIARWMTAFMLAEEYVKMGRCASCGYTLDPTLAEYDGRTICAECGAAWACPAGFLLAAGTPARTGTLPSA